MEGKKKLLLDTCVLINFAAIGRLDLLTSHPLFTFFITDHVRDEIKEHFTQQYDAVNTAVEDGTLTEIVVDGANELADFSVLVSRKNLGNGECSAIAVAKSREMSLAIDDRRARKRAKEFHAQIDLLSTESLMISLINHGVLTVEGADEIKIEWETKHSFKLTFESFGDQL